MKETASSCWCGGELSQPQETHTTGTITSLNVSLLNHPLHQAVFFTDKTPIVSAEHFAAEGVNHTRTQCVEL